MSLLTGHFSWLELGARVLAVQRPFHAMYRHVNNPLIDDWMFSARLQRTRRQPLPKRDIKTLIRALREGEAIWYAPDQTLGREAGLFLPMFGQPVWTLTATARLAKLGRARVVPYFTTFEHGQYVLRVQAPLEQFPSGDDAADAGKRDDEAQLFACEAARVDQPDGEPLDETAEAGVEQTNGQHGFERAGIEGATGDHGTSSQA